MGEATNVEVEIASLNELRAQVASVRASPGKLKVSSCLGNVQDLHADALNAGATFRWHLNQLARNDLTRSYA